ncbi:hypothetical protein Aph01nite_36140 [Acrocarpospora phusangensis]|uniref:Uncharacterized protein n=1 Tax=Acrocarpospora phusangensis TaxID=1070424 RepID=A0A919QA20_9ACTN|nr:hypothetical protein [Acrocarpospora phusangensis]GIH25304.1 hypothetical protein Aph01nite_36140 [Acrocarpospora phusangensis]
MSKTPEPGPLGTPTSLYEHALQLHRRHPDAALPDDGEPYPDDGAHRRRYSGSEDQRRRGAAAAAILDEFFARPGATPGELVWAFHEVDVPIHHNEHIAAAARRADRGRARETGRWLVGHSGDRCSVLIGLALLAADWNPDDIDLIRHIGLLSDTFGSLAAEALKRRRGGGEALLWLAQRSRGWGRVYVIETLCSLAGASARPWLLRHALDGDFLSGYYVGEVAMTADVHEAITGPDPDDALIDHTGRVLQIMAGNSGMGMTWNTYPPISRVLDAHVGYLARQPPTWIRYVTAAFIADHLRKEDLNIPSLPADDRSVLLNRYLAVLHRQDWRSMARAALDPADKFTAWFIDGIATRLKLLN